MKSIKKISAILLSVIMLCSIISVGAFANSGIGGSFDLPITFSRFVSESIDTVGDEDYFQFNVTQSGNYIIYTTGTTDTKGYLYGRSYNQIAYNDDNAGINFAIQEYLTREQTYYVKVGAYGSNTGSYTLHVDKLVDNVVFSQNCDARNVTFNAYVSQYFDSIELHIDSDPNSSIAINKNSPGVTTYTTNGYTHWSFTKSITPTTLGSSTGGYITAKKGNIYISESFARVGVFYSTNILTGINGNKTNLSSLISSVTPSGYTIEAYDKNSDIIQDTNINTSTGMVLVTKRSGKIYDVKFVVLFGDVDGNGRINAKDVTAMQRHIAGTEILKDQYFLAGDVNHDGVITDADVDLVMKFMLNSDTLSAAQNYVISSVPSTLKFN